MSYNIAEGPSGARKGRAGRSTRSIDGDNGPVPISDHKFSPMELREREVVRRAIGTVVARLRKAAALSQVEVAEQANMSERELRRIEKGVGGTPLDRLWPLARAINSTPEEIVLEAQKLISADPELG